MVVCLAGLALFASSAHAAIVVPDGGVAIRGSTADVKRGIDVAHDAGARWISLAASWESMEPSPDSYRTMGGSGSETWTNLEDQLAYAKSRGMNVELRFSNAPGWASGQEGRSDDPPTPANAQAYGDFLADVAARLGPYLDAYSPWNEPNISNFWNPVNPEAYTAVQKIAYASIKANDPSAIVLSATIVGTYPNSYDYLKRAYQAGLKGSADVIGWNSYPHGEPESAYSNENGLPSGSSLPGQLYLRDLINQFDPGRKVWIMELSWSNCVPCAGFPANGASEAQQADYLARTFAFRRRYLTGITERIFWYQLRDAGSEPHNWEHHQGLLRTDFSPKPALAAFTSVGIDVPDGTIPSPSTVNTPVGTGQAGTFVPPTGARLTLPTAARSTRGRLTLGRPRLTARRGRLALSLKVAVKGGATRVRIEGYRARRWRGIKTVTIRRSGRLKVGFPGQGLPRHPGACHGPRTPGWRVGRVVEVTEASSTRSRVALGKPRIVAIRGRLALSLKVAVKGGATRVRIEGYRAARWRGIKTVTIRRSGRLSVGFPDKAYVGIRVRAKAPRLRGWRAGPDREGRCIQPVRCEGGSMNSSLHTGSIDSAPALPRARRNSPARGLGAEPGGRPQVRGAEPAEVHEPG